MIITALLISKVGLMISTVKIFCSNFFFTLHRNSSMEVYLPHFFCYFSFTLTNRLKQNIPNKMALCITYLLQVPCFPVFCLSYWSISKLTGNWSNVEHKDDISIFVPLLSTVASTSGCVGWLGHSTGHFSFSFEWAEFTREEFPSVLSAVILPVW